MTRLFSVVLIAFLLVACASEPKRSEHKNLPRAAENNVQLGLAYMNKGQLDVALAKLKKALEQAPDLASAHNAIAILYTRLGESGQADEHYQRALSADPDDARAHNNYGLFLCDQRRYAKAETHFMKAASNPLYRSPAKAYTNAGVCLNRTGNKARAEQHFRKALQLNPLYAPALFQLARISYEQRNYLQARAYIQRYQAAARHTAETLWLAIQTEQQLRDYDAAASYGLSLKSTFPDSAEAVKYREMESRRGSR